MWNAEQAALKNPENHKSTLVSRINEETEVGDENFSCILKNKLRPEQLFTQT